MASYRSISLMILTVACGVGSGAVIALTGGIGGAILFMAFPFLVVALFASIVHDVTHEQEKAEATNEVGQRSARAARVERSHPAHPRAA